MRRFHPRIIPILLAALVLCAAGGCTKQARAKRLLQTANSDFKAEKYDAAEIEYKNVLGLSRLNPVAVGQLGRIYAKEGRVLEAHLLLEKGAELMPNSLPVQLALGQVDVTLRDFTNAARIAAGILAAQPTNDEALLVFADSFPVREARQQLESLPHIAENSAYHVALAVLALRQQKFDEAGSELRQALAADPKSSEAYFALAELHAMQRQGKEAGQALKMAAELAPLRSPVRSKYVDFLIQSGDLEEAGRILQEMTSKVPDYLPGWIGMMNLSLAEKHYDEAGRDADTILSRDERNYEGLLGRASVNMAKGETETAVARLEQMSSLYKKEPASSVRACGRLPFGA